MPQRFPRPAHAHRQRQQRQPHRRLREAARIGLVAADAGEVVEVAGLGCGPPPDGSAGWPGDLLAPPAWSARHAPGASGCASGRRRSCCQPRSWPTPAARPACRAACGSRSGGAAGRPPGARQVDGAAAVDQQVDAGMARGRWCRRPSRRPPRGRASTAPPRAARPPARPRRRAAPLTYPRAAISAVASSTPRVIGMGQSVPSARRRSATTLS